MVSVLYCSQAIARRFISRLRGCAAPDATLPQFVAESYVEALLQGDRLFRPILIFLHSNYHQDSQEFIDTVLTNPEFVQV
jgi:hypothetical protein